MNEYRAPYSGPEPPSPRKSSNTWVWVLLLALIVPMFLCAGLCGGLLLFRVKSVEVAEQHAQQAVREAVQAASEAAQQAPPFHQAMKRVQSDIDVKAKLGEPVQQTGSSTFRSQKNADGGSAELRYDIAGPRGKASVHGLAVEIDDQWWFETLDVTFPDGETIDLADVEIPIKL